MAKGRKLVCDRCGLELTGKEEINLVLEGTEAWQMAVKARGAEPRGVFPCKNYIRCCGEMIFIYDKKKSFK